jgi:response regulator of citrate/malate metabolism
MMENDVEKLKRTQDAILVLYRYLHTADLEAIGALNTVSAYITERHTEVVEGVKVIHPRQGMNKVSEAKVIKAIDLLSKEWLSHQQLANRVNLSKSSVVTALMPAVRKRANVTRQRMGKLAKPKYRITNIG